ncbi:heterokaryon incompatibility protein-domain-containing protein [Diaporthe sp. PMI_573]|nr:heterokaryon incompatibility protein-domain-containing protein [Diaporthaceae sp. PMI_573]
MASNLLHDYSTVHYPTLDADSAQIRLIILARGDIDSPIRCSYRVVDLDDENLSYETLSYVWNDGAGTEPILVDGKAVSVTRSLFGALEQLRVGCERTLWIDAICINQSDNAEKTRQVNMMGRIYSQCSQCNVWMGPLGETSSLDASHAIDTVAWIAGDMADPPAFLDDLSQRRRAAEALNVLVTNPWWTRIWTVQEAILPSRCFVYWGPCKLPWDQLERASSALDGGAPADLEKYQHEFWASKAFHCLQAGVGGLPISLHERPLHLLWRWRFRKATDPRDKVYALLGMRRDVLEQLPSVLSCNYDVDVTTLFTRVTKDLINMCTDLNPLIGRRGEPSELKDLPSWVVDWSGPIPGQGRSEFWAHEARWMESDYCADRGAFGVGEGPRFADGDERTLLLTGLYADEIAVVEERQTGGHGNAEGFHEILLDGADRWGNLIMRFQRSAAATGRAGELPDGWMQAFLGLITGRLVPGDPNNGDPYNWTLDMLRDQAVFITKGGTFGLGPLNAQPGQQLWVVSGCRLPLILEMCPGGITGKNGDEASCRDFKWVSECFVYGMMKGEAVKGRGHERVDIRLH